jgi:hypothetical protein
MEDEAGRILCGFSPYETAFAQSEKYRHDHDGAGAF